jgi:5-methylcytosine-specific restriction endonuclease McrA
MSKQELAQLARKRSMARLHAASLTLTPNEIAANLRVASDGFLASPEWKAVRLQALERYGRICCKCGASPKWAGDINVDHIKPRKFFPELSLDIGNLQPLCRRCNKRKGNGPAVDYRKAG